MTAPSCAWTVAALGPDESSQVDLVTGDLDVYVSSQDLELVEVRKSLEFAEIRRRLRGGARQASPECAKVRKIAAHQITASDLNTFTNTFLINMRVKFVTTTTTKSDDELISLKETFGLCEGRAEQLYYIPVRASRYTCVLGW